MQHRVLFIESSTQYRNLLKNIISAIDSFDIQLDFLLPSKLTSNYLTNNKADIYMVVCRKGEEKNGLNIMETILTSGANLPVIVLTKDCDRNTETEIIKAGAIDLLSLKQLDCSTLERSIRYILDKIKMMSELSRVRDISEHFLRSSLDMFMVTDKSRIVLEFSASAEKISGYKQKEVIGKPLDMLFDNSQDALNLHKSVIKNGSFIGEAMLHRSSGESLTVHISSTSFTDDKNQTAGFIYTIRDITEQKRLQDQLKHDALHDPITGLPNKNLFMDRLQFSIIQQRRKGSYLYAVLLLDLDRFKMVNDSLGHIIGDKLLKMLSSRLKVPLRANDIIARLGGDEFAILLDDIKNPENASMVADRILKQLEEPFNLKGHVVFTNASIGIVLGDASYSKTEDILRDVDTVMYRAKSQGKARFVVFDKEMRNQAVNLMYLEEDLRKAIDRQEFTLHYQPIVSLISGEITTVEALIRWNHSQRGIISPLEFIPYAEESGLINQIGEWVLREACNQFSLWQKEGFDNLRISVNFSAHQFEKKNWFDVLKGVLTETGMSSANLDMEITESSVMSDSHFGIDTLQELNRMGIKISIDDFGTGYSTLSSLRHIPINTLKIDRSFIKDIVTDPNAKAITAAIVAMAHTLDLEVVAEGVEVDEQLSFLRSQNCDKMQGYLFSRPIAADGITDMLKEKRSLYSL